MRKFFSAIVLTAALWSTAIAAVAPFTIPNNSISVGKTGAADKTWDFNLTKAGASTNPKIKWNNSSSKLQFSNDGSNFKDLGSGQGDKNFVVDNQGDGEAATTTGWSCYADAAGTSPVDGTGGSPHITWTQSSSSPLDGTGSFLYTKDAANRQGEGCSYAFTLDSTYKAKVIQIEFEYLVSSGTFTAGTSSADSDMTLWIYDVTNSTLIQPTTYKVYSNSGSLTAKVVSDFQSSATGTSYRLIMHNGNTSASAYTLKIDNVSIKPSRYVYGSPITDWTTFTPTGAFTTNTTYTGSYRRVGDSLEMQVHLAFAGAPNSVTSTINLPSGMVVDTTKLTGAVAATGPILGSGVLYQAPNDYKIAAIYNNTTSIILIYQSATTGQSSGVTQAAPVTIANGNTIDMTTFRIPIVGWSSSVQTSDRADTRVVAANYSGTPTGTLNGSLNTITYPTKNSDTHSAYSSGTYTVPVSGYYNIAAQVEVSGAFSGTQYTGLAIFINGVQQTINYVYGGSFTDTNVPVSILGFPLKAGDLVTIRCASTGSGLAYSASGVPTFSIARVSGPESIASIESVNARYYTTNAQAITTGNNAVVTTFTKDYDSHGAMNASTGVYTVPVAGKYRITGSFMSSSTAWTTGSNRYIQLGVTGTKTIYGLVNQIWASVTNYLGATVTTTASYVTGDTISLTLYNYTGSTYTLDGSSSDNWVTIERVGN